MKTMLCYNQVRDFDMWKKIFDSHSVAQDEAGLHIINLWQEMGEPNNVYFTIEFEDLEKAQTFINSPHSEQAGQEAGVIDGWIRFLE